MPALNRSLSGETLRFQLEEEAFRLCRAKGLARSGRSARTLVKDGAVRVTLVALGAGGQIPEHHAEGPITILPLSGRIIVYAQEEVHVLESGELLALGPGIPHALESPHGGHFLLTVATGSNGPVDGAT
jgi:quercetin dioxygenase-like cupin family protein